MSSVGGIDAGGGFAHPHLHGGEIGHAVAAAGHRAARLAALHLFDKDIERAARHADLRRHQTGWHHGQKRLTIDRVGIDLGAGRIADQQLGDALDAVVRHKDVVDDEALAAGAGEPHGKPVVVDSDVAPGQEEETWHLAAVGPRHRRRHNGPVGIVAAGGEAPAAGEAIAAVGRLALPVGA